MKKTTLVLLLAATLQAHAQATNKKTLVEFKCTCEENLSLRYAAAVRDLLAKSPRYEEVHANSGIFYSWQVSVVSSGLSDRDRTNSDSIALSVVVTKGGFLMTHAVLLCGSGRLQGCAENTLAALDKEVSESEQ